MIEWFVVGLVFLFGLVVLRGAPYVPSHKAAISAALDMLPLKPGDTVVDLGSGDGSFIKAAAMRGFNAVGYEVNPVLCAIAWLRCLSVRDRAKVKLRDYWLVGLPPRTKAVFVFLAGPHMKHLARYLSKHMATRTEPLFVVSNGFTIPGMQSTSHSAGLYLYKLPPTKR